MSTKSELRARAIKALQTLQGALEDEYAKGQVLSESDAEAIVIQCLKRNLQTQDENWLIGSNYRLGGYQPDVLLYYSACWGKQTFRDPKPNLLGVVEIKWAADLKGDLSKLKKISNKHDVLVWIVYGSHFDNTIHAANARRDLNRADKIEKWLTKFEPGCAGRTIIRCGEITRAKYRDRLKALRETYWDRDE